MGNAITAVFKGVVGKVAAYAANATEFMRVGRQGQMITDGLHGAYYQATKDGDIFHACSLGAGVALSVDVEGTTQSFALYNPPGSGVDEGAFDPAKKQHTCNRRQSCQRNNRRHWTWKYYVGTQC